MPIFINKASVNAGQVMGTTVLPTNERNTALQASRYNTDSELYVNTSNTPLATDKYTQGCRFDGNGAMYVRPVETLGVPSNISYDAGFAFDGTTNALLVTTEPCVRYMIGWPLDQRGYVCMGVSAGGELPGAFTHELVPAGAENGYYIVWYEESLRADYYEVRRNGTLIDTVYPPNNYTQDNFHPGAGEGGNFDYTVAAINTNGTTQSSGNPQTVLIPSPPGTPGTPSATAGVQSAVVTYTAAVDGGRAIQNYVMDSIPAVSTWYSVGNTLSITATGLTTGISYTFRVLAYNGQSGPWSAYSNAVIPT